MTNQRVIFGIKKTDVKRVTFQETEMEDCDPDDDFQASASLRTVYRKDTDSTMSKFEARLQKTEEDLKETKTIVKQILDILTELTQLIEQDLLKDKIVQGVRREMASITTVTKKGTSVLVAINQEDQDHHNGLNQGHGLQPQTQ